MTEKLTTLSEIISIIEEIGEWSNKPSEINNHDIKYFYTTQNKSHGEKMITTSLNFQANDWGDDSDINNHLLINWWMHDEHDI